MTVGEKYRPELLRSLGATAFGTHMECDAEKNFEKLWKTFFDRYPFFKLRKVDWSRQYDIFRPKVNSDTSENELFDIFCDMLAPLNDGHVELMAKTSGGDSNNGVRVKGQSKFWQSSPLGGGGQST